MLFGAYSSLVVNQSINNFECLIFELALRPSNKGHYLNYSLMINIYMLYCKMIRFNYSKTTSNIHNIQYTSKIHICNKKLYIPFYNMRTRLVFIFSVYELWITQVAPLACVLTNQFAQILSPYIFVVPVDLRMLAQCQNSKTRL